MNEWEKELESVGLTSEKIYVADFIAYEKADETLIVYKNKEATMPNTAARLTIEDIEEMTTEEFVNAKIIII